MPEWLRDVRIIGTLAFALGGILAGGFTTQAFAEHETRTHALWQQQREINDRVLRKLSEIEVHFAELGGPKDPMDPRVRRLEESMVDIGKLLASTAISLDSISRRLQQLEVARLGGEQ